MDEICRLCCSTKFVNNDIFDEENALYLKMSLYLPIKVFKNDRLPRKVCDKCSCKVNDFYQFCNETIEVQNRLRSLFLSSEACINASIDLTLVKHSASPPPSQPVQCERSTQTDEPGAPPACEVTVQVKHEPDSVSLSPVKKEEDNYYHIDSDHFDDGSSGSDDISLISLKKKKSKGSTLNGVHATDKKARKKAANMKEWGELMESLPDATLTVVESGEPGMPLDSIKEEMLAEKPQDVFHCCTCFTQCYSRAEMVQHYRQHAAEASAEAPPAAPPPPDTDPLRCPRCRKARRTSWRRAARRSPSTSASCATCVPRPSSTCATCRRTARARTRRRRGGHWRCAAGCARAASRTSTRCGATCARTRASATSCAACAARRCRRASTSSSTCASTRATSPTCAPCAARASSRSATSRCTSACTRARSRTCARTAARPSASAPRSSSTSATTAARGPTCAGSAAAASSPRGCSPCISRPPASSGAQR
ncbi:uncharacterized protein LOC124642761 isoform X3 [Helicoverpa zea]|nr:uncharacterized protein LOC124642761 isoform X3 [Helicoverpa zea]